MRQGTQRARRIAGLFREGRAADALTMKRADGTAVLVSGDEEQVVQRIADHVLARRDALQAAGAKRGVTVSAPTNADAAAISGAIRERLRARGELGQDEIVCPAIDNRRAEYDLPIAAGDRLRLFRKTFGTADGRRIHLGSNGQVVEAVGRDADGLRLRAAGKPGAQVVHVAWDRLTDRETGRLQLGFGHCLTIDSAQGITAGEHINAMPRGSAGVSAFKAYVAESRHVSQVWTMVGEAAEREAERASRPLGDPRPVTADDLWARIGRAMSEKPYKPLGIDLLAQVRRDQAKASHSFIAGRERIQRQGAGRDLTAEVGARLADDAVHRGVAGQLETLSRAVVVQQAAAGAFARSAAAQVDAWGAAVKTAVRRTANHLAVLPSRPCRDALAGPTQSRRF